MSPRCRFIATVLLLSIVLLVSMGGAYAQAPAATPERAIADALTWLKSQQAADGSFGGSAGNTIEVVLAAVAAGQDVAQWRTSGGSTALDYLGAQAAQYAVDPATTGKLTVAIAAAGLDPRDVNGLDLVAKLDGYNDGTGAFAPTALAQAWAILGLASAGSPIPQGAADALVALQQADGGWEGGPGWGTDSNTTALAIQALVAAGAAPTDPALAKASAYLGTQLSPAGGFAYSTQWGDAADANSTAYGIQGVLALGQDPATATWTRGDKTPIDALLAFQIADGACEWQRGEGANLLATAQAVPALARVTLPLSAKEEAAPAPVALEDGQALSATLVGRRAGAQTLYRLAHPGAGREVTIEVSTPAAHPLALIGFGFNVYDASGRRVGGGYVAATSPEQVLRYAGSAAAPSEWTVQVYSYIEGVTFPYTIVARGMGATQTAAAAPEATPATVAVSPTVVATPTAAATADPAQDEQPAPAAEAIPVLETEVAGTLIGERAGAFARYRLVVAESGEDVTVRMRYAPADPATSAGLGFTIYTPSGRAIASAPTGVPGERTARIASAAAGEYLVQVHNYLNGASMIYTLSR